MDKSNRRAMFFQKPFYPIAPTYQQMTAYLTLNAWKLDNHPDAQKTGGVYTEFWKSTTGYMIEIPKNDNPTLSKAALMMLAEEQGAPIAVIYERMTGKPFDSDLGEAARMRDALNFVMKSLPKNEQGQKLGEIVKRILTLKDFKVPERLE